MRYFAYGSNMSSRRLRERMPGARAESRAILPCHRLAWHKIGKDGSGKCDIVADQDSMRPPGCDPYISHLWRQRRHSALSIVVAPERDRLTVVTPEYRLVAASPPADVAPVPSPPP